MIVIILLMPENDEYELIMLEEDQFGISIVAVEKHIRY